MNDSGMKIKVSKLGSREVRLADRRIRIVRDESPDEPDRFSDLTFLKAEDETLVPEDAISRQKFDCNHEHEPIWFFTTAERCRKTISGNPDDWTPEKLVSFWEEEKKLWQAWWDGDVFGWILERWDSAEREFVREDSCWGYYGLGEILSAAEERMSGETGIAVCVPDELAGRFA